MVAEDELVEAGAELLDTLHRRKVDVRAAVWAYDTLFQAWKLVLVLPITSRIGIKKTYERIEKVLPKNSPISGVDLQVFYPDSQYAEALQQSLRGMTNRRLRHLYLNSDDSYIEDGYVYFVK